jgi:hypothetical protein
MLIVAIGPEQELDELGRTRTGYREGMSDRELYEAARGSWKLGDKADNEPSARSATSTHPSAPRGAAAVAAPSSSQASSCPATTFKRIGTTADFLVWFDDMTRRFTRID